MAGGRRSTARRSVTAPVRPLAGPTVPLARVIAGVGNGDGSGREGAVCGRVVGTYLHGPLLARNPALADLLLAWALGLEVGELPPLDDAAAEGLRRERIARHGRAAAVTGRPRRGREEPAVERTTGQGQLDGAPARGWRVQRPGAPPGRSVRTAVGGGRTGHGVGGAHVAPGPPPVGAHLAGQGGHRRLDAVGEAPGVLPLVGGERRAEQHRDR